MEVSGQLHIPAALSRGKSPLYPMYRRLGGPQTRSRRYAEEKTLAPAGSRTTVVQPFPVATLIELSRLSFRAWMVNLIYHVLFKFRLNCTQILDNYVVSWNDSHKQRIVYLLNCLFMQDI
jgi:hypothetical protein